MTELKIGSEVFIYDGCNRVYERDVNGRARGGPIYREFFRKAKITGETPRKWKTAWCEAFKKNPYETGFLTAEMVEEKVWDRDNRRSIINKVERCDIETLKRIAYIIGYKTDVEVEPTRQKDEP